MRIVSLVPAATEIACALGACEELVAVTHDCDYPTAVRELPRVTRSTLPPHLTSREIDDRVREAGSRGESTVHLDAEALYAARPEVILGQTVCAVCAVTLDQVPRALPTAPTIVPLEAESVEGVFADVDRVAAALRRAERGSALIGELRERIARVVERVAGRRRPRIACLEWLDPLMNGGHWVPEQVDLAGGVDVLGAPRERSREVALAEVVAAAPDLVVLMPCGWDAAQALREATGDRRWSETGAEVAAVDGSAYFSRPGPRLVDGIELLASLLHPGAVAPPPGAVAYQVVGRSAGAASLRNM